MNLQSLIRDIPDFPKKGILFRDISPLLKDPKAIDFMLNEFAKSCDMHSIDYIAGIESRGFILASLLAQKYQKGFIPLRKAGKLPPPVVAETYDLEYGTATLEMTPGKGRLLLVDDVLATGGTLKAAINICEKAGFLVSQVAVLIDLCFLHQMRFKNEKIFSVIQYHASTRS